MSSQSRDRHRVLIVGGGFGGLYAARALGGDERVSVTLIDRRNFHLFTPLLYQVATGALSPADIAQPLRSILRHKPNTTVLLGEAVGLDPELREVQLADGGAFGYDSLIVASGARFSYFGHDAWAGAAPGLKSLDDALEIRRRILIAFEAAEREQDPQRQAAWLTFVLVGGGPTGVELAGSLAEIARDTLRRDFRSIDTASARIILVEALPRILPTYPAGRSAAAARQLRRLGATVRTATRVVDVTTESVTVEAPDGKREVLPARTVLWAAGILASSFVGAVAQATGAPTDRNGRIKVEPDLTVPGHPEVFAVGDAAVQPWKKVLPVPGVAQGGIQGGRYAARVIQARLSGETVPPFRYSNRGDVAVIGRLAGVTDIPWLGPLGRQSGFPAWVLWLSIHILYLIGFTNRIVVVLRWGWSFFTRGRGSRLITGQPFLPPIASPETPDEPAATGQANELSGRPKTAARRRGGS